MNKNKFDKDKIVEHFYNLSQNFRNDKLTIKQVEEVMARDAMHFSLMLDKGLLNKTDFNSVLEIMTNFEDAIEQIALLKEDLNKRSNGTV